MRHGMSQGGCQPPQYVVVARTLPTTTGPTGRITYVWCSRSLYCAECFRPECFDTVVMSTPSGARKARSPYPDGEKLAPTTLSSSSDTAALAAGGAASAAAMPPKGCRVRNLN